jgi:hypothetical protein
VIVLKMLRMGIGRGKILALMFGKNGQPKTVESIGIRRSKMIEIGPNLAEVIGCIVTTIGVVIIIWRWKR